MKIDKKILVYYSKKIILYFELLFVIAWIYVVWFGVMTTLSK
jgi:hypothetical protein